MLAHILKLTSVKNYPINFMGNTKKIKGPAKISVDKYTLVKFFKLYFNIPLAV
jgi:hypothetical protein